MQNKKYKCSFILQLDLAHTPSSARLHMKFGQVFSRFFYLILFLYLSSHNNLMLVCIERDIVFKFLRTATHNILYITNTTSLSHSRYILLIISLYIYLFFFLLFYICIFYIYYCIFLDFDHRKKATKYLDFVHSLVCLE